MILIFAGKLIILNKSQLLEKALPEFNKSSLPAVDAIRIHFTVLKIGLATNLNYVIFSYYVLHSNTVKQGWSMTTETKIESKWDVQLRKGTLELVILAALKERKLYGLELLGNLHGFETMMITEGTLYPLLDRFKRDKLIDAQCHQSGETRPRKYYHLTKQGGEKLLALTIRWRKSVEDIEFILNHPGPETLNPKGV